MKVRDIIKTDGIILATADETLASVQSQLSSSHDAAFIFAQGDKKGQIDTEKFMGVINPFYCYIKKSNPPQTKIGKCLFHPPKLKISDKVERAARLMIESKVHYLPVFEDHTFKGIVTARRILRAVCKTGGFSRYMSDVLREKRPLVTIYENDTLAHALSLFKRYKISKLVVINRAMKLRGVLAYYDLLDVMSSPKDRVAYASMSGEKTRLGSRPIKRYYKTAVLTLSHDKPLGAAAQLILNREIGSVIITDSLRRPQGIITTKDLLSEIAAQFDITKIIVRSTNLIDAQRQVLVSYGQKLAHKVAKRGEVKRVLIKVERGSRGIVQGIVSIDIKRHPHKIVRKQARNFQNLMKDLKESLSNILSKK